MDIRGFIVTPLSTKITMGFGFEGSYFYFIRIKDE